MSTINTMKTAARWGGPTVTLVAFYVVAAGVPSLPATALLVAGGLVLSWLTPKVIDFIKSKVS